MKKDYYVSKYSKRRAQDRHCGRRCRSRMYASPKLRREKSKQRRRQLRDFVSDERSLRSEKEMRLSGFSFADIYLEEGFADGLCDCSGFDENGSRLCPYGASVSLFKVEPVLSSFPHCGKYYRTKDFK